jgi:hypothetical protein
MPIAALAPGANSGGNANSINIERAEEPEERRDEDESLICSGYLKYS